MGPVKGVCCQRQTASLEPDANHGVCSKHIVQTN